MYLTNKDVRDEIENKALDIQRLNLALKIDTAKTNEKGETLYGVPEQTDFILYTIEEIIESTKTFYYTAYTKEEIIEKVNKLTMEIVELTTKILD